MKLGLCYENRKYIKWKVVGPVLKIGGVDDIVVLEEIALHDDAATSLILHTGIVIEILHANGFSRLRWCRGSRRRRSMDLRHGFVAAVISTAGSWTIAAALRARTTKRQLVRTSLGRWQISELCRAVVGIEVQVQVVFDRAGLLSWRCIAESCIRVCYGGSVEQFEVLVVNGAGLALFFPLLLSEATGVSGQYLLIRRKSRIRLVHSRDPWCFALGALLACARTASQT